MKEPSTGLGRALVIAGAVLVFAWGIGWMLLGLFFRQ